MAVDNEVHPLLVHQIEKIAADDPSRVWASIQRDPDPSKGFRDVTWTELIRAVDRAAHWIAQSLGGSSTSNETLTILGPSDIRYPITLVAAIKTGRKIQFGSPGLTPQGRAALLEKSDCTVVLCDADQYWLSAFDELAKERPVMRKLVMPELNDWLAPGEVEPYPYSETWEEVVEQPVACFHTSGTTGAPKPVVYRNSSLGVFHTLAALRGSDPSLSISTPGNGRVLSTFPFFHVGGINMGLWVPAFFSGIPVLPWPYILPTPEHVVGGIRYGNVQAASLIPSVLESMTREPEQLKLLLTLKAIRWGSGPLSQACGDLMSRSVPFFQTAYGSTEMCFPLTRKVLEPEDWSYIDFHEYAGLTFEPRDDGLYELVVNRTREHERYQSIWTTKPELTRYESKDLWRPHPTKPSRWQFAGRRDDMLALSTGYKLFIADKEQTIKDHPLVKSALLGGQGREKPFLLLELYDRAQDQVNGHTDGQSNGQTNGHTNGHTNGTDDGPNSGDALLDAIWPAVEKANKTLVGEMRLSRGLMVIAPRDKPFARTGKDSVDRRGTFELFGKEIEALYQ